MRSVMSCSVWSRPLLGKRPRANKGSGGTMAPCLGAGRDHGGAGRETPESPRCCPGSGVQPMLHGSSTCWEAWGLPGNSKH